MADLNQVSGLISAADAASSTRAATHLNTPLQAQRHQASLARESSDGLRNINARLAALQTEGQQLAVYERVQANSSMTNATVTYSATGRLVSVLALIGGELASRVDHAARHGRSQRRYQPESSGESNDAEDRTMGNGKRSRFVDRRA